MIGRRRKGKQIKAKIREKTGDKYKLTEVIREGRYWRQQKTKDN